MMKLSSFDKFCWLLLIYFSIFLFCSCATSKRAKPCNQCPSYSQEIIVMKDTLYFNQIHEHYCDDIRCYCVYLEAFSLEVADTLYIEHLVFLK